MKAMIVRWVSTYLIRNWRTTVVGVVGFVATQFPGVPAWLAAQGYSMDAVQGLLLMIIAFLAKDGSVSGSAPAPVATDRG